MLILITGTSRGIGKAIALRFLQEKHDVIGFDIEEKTIDHVNYVHHIIDVSSPSDFIDNIYPDIIVNNAGVQDSGKDIDINLKGVINITEKYAFDNPNIKAVTIIGSASGHTGSEFYEYAASKGGLLAYTKNVANRLAPKAICNSIDPGGVITELNKPVMDDEKLFAKIMELTPLKRWATCEEIADWVYFVSVINKFMTGQNLLIDGGEAGYNQFIWPEDL